MSIDPISTPSISPSPGASAASRSAPASGAIANEDSVMVDTFPSTPPPEVIDAIGVAHESYGRLLASGRELHFQTQSTGRVSVQVRDLQGTVLGSLTPSQALAVAAGDPLH